MHKVYLFPLSNSCLFKKVTLPYHIFEPRYLKMIHDAKANNHKVAVLYPQEYYEGEYVVAGTPVILRDGETVDIIITGETKYKLNNLESSKPYLIYDAVQVDEQRELDEDSCYEFSTLKNLLHQFVEKKSGKLDEPNFARLMTDPEFVISYACLFLVRSKTIQKQVMRETLMSRKINVILDHIANLEYPDVKLSPFLSHKN